MNSFQNFAYTKSSKIFFLSSTLHFNDHAMHLEFVHQYLLLSVNRETMWIHQLWEWELMFCTPLRSIKICLSMPFFVKKWCEIIIETIQAKFDWCKYFDLDWLFPENDIECVLRFKLMCVYRIQTVVPEQLVCRMHFRLFLTETHNCSLIHDQLITQ